METNAKTSPPGPWRSPVGGSRDIPPVPAGVVHSGPGGTGPQPSDSEMGKDPSRGADLPAIPSADGVPGWWAQRAYTLRSLRRRRGSGRSLATHLGATAFEPSICRGYSGLTGLAPWARRRRRATAGFGPCAVRPTSAHADRQACPAPMTSSWRMPRPCRRTSSGRRRRRREPRERRRWHRPR